MARPARVSRIGRFDRHYKGLDRRIQRVFDLKIEAMKVNWQDPWLHPQKMEGAVARWRFKVNHQYRMVAGKATTADGFDEFTLEFVGTKNEFKKAY